MKKHIERHLEMRSRSEREEADMEQSRGEHRISLRAAAVMMGGIVVAFFAGTLAVRATPGGEVRPTLMFSGTLTGAQNTPLTFEFKKNGAPICKATTNNVTTDSKNEFNIQVDLSPCPSSLFDGGDVTYDISVGATLVVSGQSIHAVPYARYAERTGTPDCPVGYDVNKKPYVPNNPDSALCHRKSPSGAVIDEVVKVGRGTSAFWIDRYEASIWGKLDMVGTGGDGPFGSEKTFPTTFPASGQWTVPLFAASVRDVKPSAQVTWFQASAACRASGKQLPTGDQWLEAARRTPDPAQPNGVDPNCLTDSTAPRFTARGWECISAWGAEDMIGNLHEWTAEWYAGVGTNNTEAPAWAPGFGNDTTYNINSTTFPGGGMAVTGAPSAAVRGGSGANKAGAGVFALNLSPRALLHQFIRGISLRHASLKAASDLRSRRRAIRQRSFAMRKTTAQSPERIQSRDEDARICIHLAAARARPPPRL